MVLGQAFVWPSIFFVVREICWDAAFISPHPNPLPLADVRGQMSDVGIGEVSE